MTDPTAAKIIDKLIILLGDRDYNAVDEGLEYTARIREEHSDLPVTLSLVPLLPTLKDSKAVCRIT